LGRVRLIGPAPLAAVDEIAAKRSIPCHRVAAAARPDRFAALAICGRLSQTKVVPGRFGEVVAVFGLPATKVGLDEHREYGFIERRVRDDGCLAIVSPGKGIAQREGLEHNYTSEQKLRAGWRFDSKPSCSRGKGKPMLYFAYGSNMDWAQMQQRCPDAGFRAIGLLDDHRLCFPRRSKLRECGVASIHPVAGERV